MLSEGVIHIYYVAFIYVFLSKVICLILPTPLGSKMPRFGEFVYTCMLIKKSIYIRINHCPMLTIY